MERFHDRPFQDFVAHETHRLISRDRHVLSIENEMFLPQPVACMEKKRGVDPS